jgi:hypothetical protein
MPIDKPFMLCNETMVLQKESTSSGPCSVALEGYKKLGISSLIEANGFVSKQHLTLLQTCNSVYSPHMTCNTFIGSLWFIY